MDVILCGGGDIGGAAAEMLTASGDLVTVIDSDAARLDYLEEHLDISVVHGSASSATVLQRAGAARADAVIATTDSDEVNLVICDVAASLGAGRTLARVDHSMFLKDESIDYAALFSVDQLFSPDRAMAMAMASRLRSPAAIAIEHFADSRIELQQVEVVPHAPAIGEPLRTLGLPSNVRLAAITRHGTAFLPNHASSVEAGDIVTIVAERAQIQKACRLFSGGQYGRRVVAISGAPTAAVWLCRLLGEREFDVRLFETDADHAENVSAALPHVTVLNCDPGQPEIFMDEHLERADAFISMRSDEQNLLACAYAAQHGVPTVMPVTRHAEFEPLVHALGIEHTWSPRQAAMQAIRRHLHAREYEQIDGFFSGTLELMRVRVGSKSSLAGHTLKELPPDPPLLVLACEDPDGTPFVPGGETSILAGGHMIALTRSEDAFEVRTLLDAEHQR